MLHLDAEVHVMAARPTDHACLLSLWSVPSPALTVVAFPLTSIPPTSLRAVALLNGQLSTTNLRMTKAMCLSFLHLLLGAGGSLRC